MLKGKLRYSIFLSVTLLIVILFGFLGKNTLIAQLNYVVNKVIYAYSGYLPIVSRVSFSSFTAVSANSLFTMLSLSLSCLLSFLLIRRRRAFLAIICIIILIGPCFVLVDTLPSILSLLIVCTVLFTLYVSSYVRRYDGKMGGLITMLTALVMAMLVMVLYFLNPIAGYKRSERLDDMLTYAMDSIDDVMSKAKADTLKVKAKGVRQEINLADEGHLRQTHTPVMTIKSSYNGRLYLKGVAYANYDKNTWTVLNEKQEKSYPNNYSSITMSQSYDVNTDIIKISTMSEERVIYTPYYLSDAPDIGTQLYDVLIRNDTGAENYSVTYKPFDENNTSFYCEESDEFNRYKDFVYENYLSVPEITKTEMLQKAEDKGFSDLPKTQLIEEVRNYVENSAQYSLDTEKVPYGKDVSTWLLNESDTGYCVHFATTLSVMLRSLGIPSRYVTGFCVNSDSDYYTLVTSDDAHAWVEYFDDNIGWVPIDSTPTESAVTEEESKSYETAEDEQPSTEPSTNKESDSQLSDTDLDEEKSVEVKATTVASISESTFDDSAPKTSGFSKSVIAIGIFMMIVLIVLILRRVLVLKLRERSFSKSGRNNRAKNIFKYIAKISQYNQIPIPKNVTDIAQKARFSNVRISESELETMIVFAKKRKKAILEDASFMKRLYLKYILVLV